MDAEEVLTSWLEKGEIDGTEPGLVGYWRLNDGSALLPELEMVPKDDPMQNLLYVGYEPEDWAKTWGQLVSCCTSCLILITR